MSKMPVWTWRDAIRQASVPPLTKLVLYSIANYLSDVGAGCFPGGECLVADSGMSQRSVTTHLQIAADAGLLVIEKRRSQGGQHLRNHYLPKFPDVAELARRPATELADMQPTHNTENQAFDHVQEMHMDGEPCAADANGPCAAPASHHVQELPTNSPRDNTPRKERFPLTPASGGTGPSAGFGFDQGDTSSYNADPKPPAPPICLDRKQATWLATLRAEGRHAPVVDGLIAPLLERFRFSSANGLEDLRAATVSARNLPAPHLAKVLQVLADDGVDTVKPARLIRAIEAVKAGGLMIAINRQRTPQQWRAWVDHFAATDAKKARLMDRFDSWTVPATWPPSAKPSADAAADALAGGVL